MGIELPPELADVAAQAGVSWPEADEEAMARSAQAWRDAATSMSAVTTDADTTVRSALDSVRGETGTAASHHWATFVEPDSGHLTATVRGCNDAADRLEHAANQVGAAKVEIVRNLVSLAQNSDAAHSAAAAGHPMALAGLDTAVRGTSANIANIESNLVDAVRPSSGVDMAGVRDPVDANPGSHGPGVHTLVSDTVAGTTAPADHTTHHAADLATDAARGDLTGTGGHPGDHPGDHSAGRPGGLVADTTRGVTHLVADTTNLTGDATDPGGGSRGPLGDATRGATHLVGDAAQGATHVVGDAAHGAADLAGDTAPGPAGHGTGDAPHPVTGTGPNLPGDLTRGTAGVPGHAPGLGDPEVTGPVPVDGSWTPGLDDRPTPPTGQTVQAGFAGGVDVPAAGPVANLPPAAPPVGGVPAPGAQAGGGTPGFGGGTSFGGAPAAPAPGGVVGGPAGGVPAGGAVPARPVPGAPAPGAAGGAVPGAPARPGDAAPRLGAPRPPEVAADPRRVYAAGAPQPPGQGVAAAAAVQPDKERDQALALFWVHMFPIGHMPVAADRPARQLPPPPPELDYAPGMRFEPGDHPRSDLVDSAGRRAALRDGVAPLEPSDPLPAGDPRVAALAEGHDPLGGEHERDWDRRYLVRFGSVTAQGISREGVEFAWPPGEQYPEGGSAQAEAEVLEEGAELDRFGRWDGRVFAAAGTPFAQRSLPPAHLEHGYRRYRVLRPVPVWRAVSAAWFAQTGGGVRYRTTHSAMELVALGYLADITTEEA